MIYARGGDLVRKFSTPPFCIFNNNAKLSDSHTSPKNKIKYKKKPTHWNTNETNANQTDSIAKETNMFVYMHETFSFIQSNWRTQ